MSFIKHVRATLTNLRYDAKAYAGHSFQIGAATTAAERGIEDSTISITVLSFFDIFTPHIYALGRWRRVGIMYNGNIFHISLLLPRSEANTDSEPSEESPFISTQ